MMAWLRSPRPELPVGCTLLLERARSARPRPWLAGDQPLSQPNEPIPVAARALMGVNLNPEGCGVGREEI